MKPSSRYILAHLSSTSCSKSGLKPFSFLRCLCELELSLQSRAPFVDLIFQKWSICETELSLQSCAHFVDHFHRSSRETAETEPFQRRPWTAILPKKLRVSHQRTFSNVNSRVPDRPHSLLLDDDVFDMMVWLT